MVLVSLAKLDKYYVVDGKMLSLDKKKWIPDHPGQPDMDGTSYNLGGSYELEWSNGMKQIVPANTQLKEYSFFGGKRKRKSKSKRSSRRRKTKTKTKTNGRRRNRRTRRH
jgi:hypothetical protein